MVIPSPTTLQAPSRRDYKDIKITTQTVQHSSQAVNYGKPIPLDYYVVWCLKCGEKECSTMNVVDGEEVAGTIQDPVIYLWGARCKTCLKEWYF
jgi:hypothetical protein